MEALQSYSSHLESSFVKIALPPTAPNAAISPSFDLSPTYLAKLDREFTRVYEEYTRRVATVGALGENIIQLWAELGTPQAQTDAAIVKYSRESPEQLGLHEDDMARLKIKHEKLIEEKKLRERRLKELKAAVEGLWERLGIEELEQKRFLNANRGCGIRQINEFEDELGRLNELKRQNLHLFVEDARYKLQELWESLYFSEDEMLEFTPAFSDVYSDALLEAHEQEISRLEALKEQRAPTLALIDKHRSLVKDRDELAASSQDASRLMMRGQKGEKRDPTRLLREEKMRKRIAKELPKIAADLRKTLEQWEDEYGRPFLVHGERYLDELEASEAKPAPGPRSKTPGAIAPPSATKQVAKSASQGHLSKSTRERPPSSATGTLSRGNSVMRAPPPRSKTPTAGSTLRRNNTIHGPPSSVGQKTPSKIPARAPLSNLLHGSNSPDRPVAPRGELRLNESRMGKMGPPPSRVLMSPFVPAPVRSAPPPMMRALETPVRAPTPVTYQESYRSGSVLSSGSVRHVSPEDVYDDRRLVQYRHQAQYNIDSMMHQDPSQFGSSTSYPQAPPPANRQTSNHSDSTNDSRSTTVVSNSENWETYDDVTESEIDASDVAYYAKVRAANNKRYTPEDGYSAAGTPKKAKGFPPLGVTVDEEGNRIASNTESNWTTDDDY